MREKERRQAGWLAGFFFFPPPLPLWRGREGGPGTALLGSPSSGAFRVTPFFAADAGPASLLLLLLLCTPGRLGLGRPLPRRVNYPRDGCDGLRFTHKPLLLLRAERKRVGWGGGRFCAH